MNIKVQCACGSKFSFEVEPVDGQMPWIVNCPTCNADATDAANEVIAANLSAQAQEPPRARLRVAGGRVSAPQAPKASEQPDGTVFCNRHQSKPAADVCVVCGKPICLDCMALFGYLCSATCRFQAEQERIEVPVYQFQKSRVESRNLRKGLFWALSTIGLVVVLFCFWVWFDTFGTRPRLSHTIPASSSTNQIHGLFAGKNMLLVVEGSRLALHDIKNQKDIWTTTLNPNETKDKTDGDWEEMFFPSYPDELLLCASWESFYIFNDRQIHRVDIASGKVKQTIPIRGRIVGWTPERERLIVTSAPAEDRRIITEIDLTQGTAKNVEAVVPRSEKKRLSSDELPPGVLPTAALLLDRALDDQKRNEPFANEISSEFFSAGQNLVELRVRLLEPNAVAVETMKKRGPSKLNGETRASSNAGAIAEEIFNDLKRSRTGGIRWVDESRYSVRLRRWVGETPVEWTGDVVGVPCFFPMNTVDLVVAGKTLIAFDKQNNKLFESQLSYRVDKMFEVGRWASPALEVDNVLFFFDQGVLTAFDLPSGTIRWRLTTFGISHVQTGKDGMLYVNTTDASADDVKYIDQISFKDTPPVILKVDPKNGKTIWKRVNRGQQCFVTDKYLFSANVSVSGLPILNSLSEALGQPSKSKVNFQLYRLDPKSGKDIWTYSDGDAPQAIYFQDNRFVIQCRNEIKVLKFFAWGS